MELSPDIEDILLMSSSDESIANAPESSQPLLHFNQCESVRDTENNAQALRKHCQADITQRKDSENNMDEGNNSELMETHPQGVFTPLESYGYVSFPGGNAFLEEDKRKLQRTLAAVKPLPSYQIPVFGCPTSSSFVPRPPSQMPPIPKANMFSWPNSIPPNDIQGSPTYFPSSSSLASTFPQPTAFLYLPVLPILGTPTSGSAKPCLQETLPYSSSSRKRQYQSDSISEDNNSDDEYDCDCDDCKMYLLEDSEMSEDYDRFDKNNSRTTDSNYCHCCRKCSLPLPNSINRDKSAKTTTQKKKYMLRRSVSCSSLHPPGFIESAFTRNAAFSNGAKATANSQSKNSCDCKISGNEVDKESGSESDSENGYEVMNTSDSEAPDMNSRGTSPQNNSIAANESGSQIKSLNNTVNSHGSVSQDKNDTQSFNQSSVIPLSSCMTTLSMPNGLTSASLDHSAPSSGVPSLAEPALNLSMQNLSQMAAACLALKNNKDSLANITSSPSTCTDAEKPHIDCNDPITPEPSPGELQDSLDEQILQALRAALGIPEDVEIEEYEPVDEDDEENDNADDEEDDTLETSVSPEEPQDPRGCLALVEDVVLSYGKISSASDKIRGWIEGNVCRVVIGGFIVSTSHITRDKGRAGYCLGFYLDDLEINSFILQVQDGILRVGGRRNKVDIYLRIEIGAPVRTEDVNVNHNKATNAVWVEVFF